MRTRHIHANSDEWVVVHRDPSPVTSSSEDFPWWIIIVGSVVFVWILSLIPAWVYWTVGGLVALGGIYWLLDVIGAFDAIGKWWKNKPAAHRAKFRKACWWTLIAIALIILAIPFPIMVLTTVGSLAAGVFLGRVFRIRRRKSERERPY